jgi:membrane protein DedA with SNARE-associated domain
VLPLLIVADLIGDIIYYLIGVTGGKKLIEKYGHKFKLPEERMNTIKQSFKDNGGKILFFGKTQPYGSLILLLSGAAKMDFRKFVLYNFIGTVPKTILFFTVGYLFGYGVINNFVSYVGIISIILGLLLLVAYFLLIKKLSSKENLI